MNRKEILNVFGKCYNEGSFSSFDQLMSDDITYEAYDCMYKVTSINDVVTVLNDSIKGETSAYSGFYRFKEKLLKHLTECILICDNDNLKCIRVVHVKLKRGKIVNIVGYHPSEFDFTRGKKI